VEGTPTGSQLLNLGFTLGFAQLGFQINDAFLEFLDISLHVRNAGADHKSG
jgi:hypothetical protein